VMSVADQTKKCGRSLRAVMVAVRVLGGEQPRTVQTVLRWREHQNPEHLHPGPRIQPGSGIAGGLIIS
jgi:hypothetical protein